MIFSWWAEHKDVFITLANTLLKESYYKFTAFWAFANGLEVCSATQVMVTDRIYWITPVGVHGKHPFPDESNQNPAVAWDCIAKITNLAT